MIVAGPEGFQKNQYRKFNIRSTELTPGDDFGMMREVLRRRFKRLMDEAPRPEQASPRPQRIGGRTAPDRSRCRRGPRRTTIRPGRISCSSTAAAASSPPRRRRSAALGITDLPLLAVAKGPDREAGLETFFMPGREPFKLKPRDPVLYFIQRLRDEAHRFAVGSHRVRRRRDIREAGLQEIPGIGPTRKRALLRHFGTLKAIERAALVRSRPGARHQRRNRAQDLRLLHDACDRPTPAGPACMA